LAVFFYSKNKTNQHKIDKMMLNEFQEAISEPIISYSLFTVDNITGCRFINQASADFPHHFGILKNQFIEIDWNIINADWISIEGVGYVQSVGKMAFYPVENTVYKLKAKNKEMEIEQAIYVRVFPVNIKTELFEKVPEIKFKTELQIPKIEIGD